MERLHQCLGERTLLALSAGEIEAGHAATLLAEASRCPECLLLLGEAGRAIAEDAGDTIGEVFGAQTRQALVDGELIAGRFRVEQLLGQGGMGEVYATFDTELGETVALKTIRSSLATAPGMLESFRQEAKLARRVVHPHVCRVLEFGRHHAGDTPVYFLTMELLRGITLSRHLREQRRLPPLVAANIARQLAAGLTAIHREGVLHRDIKTNNVMLCPPPGAGEESRAVLLDFGIARGVALGDASTSSAAHAGTPSYMAPEQLQNLPLTAAADVYSLGVVLFELITGQLPFGAAESPTSALAQQQLNRPRLSSALADAETPAPLANLVLRCLEHDPEWRFAAAHQVERELAALQEGVEAAAPRAPRASTGRRWRWLALPAALAAIGLAYAIGRSTPPNAAATQTTAAGSRQVPPRQPASPLPPTLSAPAVAASALTASRLPAPVITRAASRQVSYPKAPSPAPPLTPARDCSPPYYFDEQGFRVFRRECL